MKAQIQSQGTYMETIHLNCLNKVILRYNEFFLSFLLNLWGWHWFTNLCRFQVYNAAKHHLHTASLFKNY